MYDPTMITFCELMQNHLKENAISTEHTAEAIVYIENTITKLFFFIIINNICNKRFLNHTMWCVNSKLWSLQNIMGIFEV